MKPTLLLLALGAVALLGANIISREKTDHEPVSNLMPVKDEKSDLENIKTEDPEVDVYVSRKSIQEHEAEGITFRTAQVIYHLKKPKIVRGKVVHYLFSEVAYQCDHKLFVTSQVILLDENVDPLFRTKEVSEAETAAERTNAWYELNHVCGIKLNKTSPKSAPIETLKPKKYLEI